MGGGATCTGGLTLAPCGKLLPVTTGAFCALRASSVFKALAWAALLSRLWLSAEVDLAPAAAAPPVVPAAVVAAGVAGVAAAVVAGGVAFWAVFAPPNEPKDDFAVPGLAAFAFFGATASFFTGLGTVPPDADLLAEVDFPEEKPPENLCSSLAVEKTGKARSAIRMIFDVFMVLETAKSCVSVAVDGTVTSRCGGDTPLFEPSWRDRRFTADKPDAQGRQAE